MATEPTFAAAELPNLLREQIASIVREANPSAALTPAQWSTLTDALQRYLSDKREWEGYLTGAQADALAKVMAKAEMLMTSIEDARTANAAWLLSAELADFATFETNLQRLTSLELATPRVKRLQKAPVENLARSNLQRSLDEWWQRTTGKRPRPQEDKKDPFMKFVEHVLTVFPESEDLGHSYKAVKDRQAKANEGRRAVRALASKLQELERRRYRDRDS